MITDSYRAFCEELWSAWCSDSLTLPRNVAGRFQMDHAPEPYLRFGTGSTPLYVLFTNPGVGMQHQHRENIRAGQSCISSTMSYYDAALRLGAFYRSDLPVGAARIRNDALEHLRKLVDADCIVQFESLPFHSRKLPGKHGIPRLVQQCSLLGEYVAHLTETLKRVSAVALSAVDSSRSISVDSVRGHPWLQWQATLLSIDDPERLVAIPLVVKSGKVTSAFLCQREGDSTHGFVLTMGGNTFPAAEGRRLIAGTLRNDGAV